VEKMNIDKFNKVFPFGSHLCREPMPPMAEMKRDMENLKKHGFNLIKLQEHWQIDEPVEGKYDFSRYEELIEYAAGLDLGVYLGLTCEQAPAWLWKKHPDCRMVGQTGLPLAYEAQTTMPGDGKPGPCYDSPGAMEDMKKFIRQLVQILGRFENIVVWNTWQEIGVGWSGEAVCYCANTMQVFRSWLKERFSGNLDALNSEWNTRHVDWSDIVPDRCAARQSVAVNVAWQHFLANERIARILRARAETIREADHLKRPVFAHKGGPIIGSGQDWTYASCQDFLGSSCYPAWNPARYQGIANDSAHDALVGEMYFVARYFDYIRSCNRRGAPVWAAEFQGGPINTNFHKGRVPYPEDMRRWLLTAVASGVSGISFWVTRAEIMALECNGFSLLDSEGDTTQRFEEATRIGQALNNHADLFGKASWPGAEVGILINEWNYQFCANMAQGGGNLATSVGGWHRILWEAGIPVDFVEVSDLEKEYISRYRILILPFPLSLSEETARKLTRYVESGGMLLSEAAPGRINEWAFCTRGELSPEMGKLFGVRQKSFTMVREPAHGAIWSPPQRTWGEYLDAAMLEGVGMLAGRKLRANVYLETFECRGSEPCLKYGSHVAAAWRAVGQGIAVLLGTYVGHNGVAYPDPETRATVVELLKSGGGTSQHSRRLLLRKRAIPGKEAWLFTNPMERSLTERVCLAGWRNVEDLFGEPVQRAGDWVDLTVKSLDVRVLVLTK